MNALYFAMLFAAAWGAEQWLGRRRPDLSRSARQMLVLRCLVLMAATTSLLDWIVLEAT